MLFIQVLKGIMRVFLVHLWISSGVTVNNTREPSRGPCSQKVVDNLTRMQKNTSYDIYFSKIMIDFRTSQ